MLLSFDEMPDEAEIHVFITSRALVEDEQGTLLGLTNDWLEEWVHAFPDCQAAKSQMILNARVLVWAINSHPREYRGIEGGLIGTELDPWYARLKGFEAALAPPVSVESNMGFLVEGNVVALGPQIRDLVKRGLIQRDTLVFDSCTMADWRAGRFLHPVSDLPTIVEQLGL